MEKCSKSWGCHFINPIQNAGNFRDHIHLNKDGISVLLKAIKSALNPLLGKTTMNISKLRSTSMDTIMFNGPSDPFSNFYASPLRVGNETFLTAEHLFQYRMATLLDYQDLAQEIKSAESPFRAKQLAKNLPKNRDLELSVLRDVVRIKQHQCHSFAAKLRESGERQLVENTRDDFWGKGPGGSGSNNMGKLLMELRNKLNNDSKGFFPDGHMHQPPHVGTTPDMIHHYQKQRSHNHVIQNNRSTISYKPPYVDQWATPQMSYHDIHYPTGSATIKQNGAPHKQVSWTNSGNVAEYPEVWPSVTTPDQMEHPQDSHGQPFASETWQPQANLSNNLTGGYSMPGPVTKTLPYHIISHTGTSPASNMCVMPAAVLQHASQHRNPQHDAPHYPLTLGYTARDTAMPCHGSTPGGHNPWAYNVNPMVPMV
jgi:ribA/ribD-fused uncharacterized protein